METASPVMRAPKRSGMARAFALLALAGACGGTAATLRTPRAGTVTSAAGAAPSNDAGAAPKEPVFALPEPHLVLDNPVFVTARDRARAKDWAAAAAAFDGARGLLVGTDAGTSGACALDYTAGRLHLAAGENVQAAAAFERVPAACVLAEYAALRGATANARAGFADAAIASARRIAATSLLVTDAKPIVAEALSVKGDRVGAVVIWRELLAANPRGPRWVDTAVKLAQALLDGVEGDTPAKAREAFELSTRVVVEAPKLADASGAQATRDRAISRLQGEPSFSAALSDLDHARRAQGFLDVGEATKAAAEALLVLNGPAGAKPGPLSCRVAVTRAHAVAKQKASATLASQAWGDAITRCAGDDASPGALYNGAKASVSAKRVDEALARYADLERLFPMHRLADDARFHAALLARDAGDDARFEAMMLALPADYPAGDMKGEALFRVALSRATRGDWEGAKGPLDAVIALDPSDLGWATAARAAYFRARAEAATSHPEEAASRYAAVVQSAPLTFYMTQAYARLVEMDPARAKKTLDDAVLREHEGPLLTHPRPELGSPSFQRALGLLEVEEVDDARREIGAAHLDAPSNDPELLWAIAFTYNAANAPEVGHAFARGKLKDHLAHYPAGRFRACWQVAYPRAFDGLVVPMSAANGIPAPLTWGIMREESSFIADVKSPADAFGLMQLIVPTARLVARGTGLPSDEFALRRPEVSVALGTKLLASLRASYPVNPALAIAAYNGGGGAVGRWVSARPHEDFDLWVEEIPYEETRGYIKRVLSSEAAYAYLYAPESLNDVLAVPVRVAP